MDGDLGLHAARWFLATSPACQLIYEGEVVAEEIAR